MAEAGRARLSVSWRQALAWRMRRHHLGPAGGASPEAVVERLCGVQAQVTSSAELAVRVRRERSEPGELVRALAEGRVVKTWAMRGTLHAIDPVVGAAFLSLIASERPWARPSWQRAFGMTPDRIETLREAVRRALDGRVLTREELIEAVTAEPGLGDHGAALRSGWGTLLKPLAWQGELCHGPSQGNRVTFMRPDAASDRWAGLPDPEAAAPLAVAAYLGAHGPATVEAFGQWLAGGIFGKRRIQGWFMALGERLAGVDVGGRRAYILAEHADELAASRAADGVRLLPGFDQYVLAPGTSDGAVVPPARRSVVSRQSGWISPVVIAAGVVAGTWELDGDIARVAPFPEAGRLPPGRLEAEVARLGAILGRALRLDVGPVAAT